MLQAALSRLIAPCALLLLLHALPGSVHAQDLLGLTDTPAASPAEATGPEAIAVTDLQDRADTDERFAEQVILRARGDDPGEQLEPGLKALAASVQEKTEHFTPATLRAMPVMRLEGLERHWKFDERRFQLWEQALRAASEPYASAAADLSQRRSEWEATLKATEEGGMPSALVAQVKTVIARLQAAENAISKPLQHHIDLGRRGNAVEAQINAGEEAVAAAISHIDRRLFHADAKPLWQVPAEEGIQRGTLAAMQSGATSESAFMSAYSSSNLYNQRVLNAFQLLLLPLLLWLSFYSRRHPDQTADIQDEGSLRVLKRPIASWLMLSMMGVLVFEPDAPLVIHQVAMLVALVPVLRLLPPHAYRLLGPWPFVATSMYLLLRLGYLLLANAFLYRWYFLLLTVAALGLSGWLLWRVRRRENLLATRPLGKALVAALWGGGALLVIALVANLVGAFSLSEVLVRGVIDSGYMALVLYVAVVVFRALVQLLIRERKRFKFQLSRDHATPLLNLVTRLASWGAIAGWVVFAMNRFRIFRPVYGWVTDVLAHEFNIGAITLTLGHVLVFVLGVFVAFWIAKTVRFVLAEEVTPRMSLPRGVGNSIASLTYYALLLLGLMVALSAAGFEVGQLAFLFGALGVGIGFGLQNIVNNFVSGLILMFERPIQPGDVVDIGTTSGNVREIGMRATTIKTFDGADVVVPNGTLLSENLTNWTLRDMFRRIEINVGTAYGSDPEQVIAVIMDVVSQDPGVSRHPAPAALFMELGASSLDFSVRAWTRDYDNWLAIRSRLLTAIYAALNANGIEIPFPQRDLHLRSVSDDARLALSPPPDADHGTR